MGKTKAVLLLSARPEVREQIMDSPELLNEAIDGSKRQFEQKVKELQATIDLRGATLADTEQQLKAAHKTIEQMRAVGKRALDEQVPAAAALVRRDGALLGAEVMECLDDFRVLGRKLAEFDAHGGAARTWVGPVAVSLLSALLGAERAVRGHIEWLVAEFALEAMLADASPADKLALVGMATPGKEERMVIELAMADLMNEVIRKRAKREQDHYTAGREGVRGRTKSPEAFEREARKG